MNKLKQWFERRYYRLKYIYRELQWLKIFCSPFIRPKLRLYCGEASIGTPFFYPRKWVRPNDKMALEAAEKEIQRLEQRLEKEKM